MPHSMDIKPITYLKGNAAEILQYINETHRPIVITQNGEPKAVLQDPASYEATRQTLALLRLVAMGEDDIRNRRVQSHKEVFDKLSNKLKNRGK